MPFFFFPYNQISCDLVPADLEGAIGLHLEVKRTERLSHYLAIEQAEADAGEHSPLLLHRRNGKRWLAVLYLDDLVDVADAVTRLRARSVATELP